MPNKTNKQLQQLEHNTIAQLGLIGIHKQSLIFPSKNINKYPCIFHNF